MRDQQEFSKIKRVFVVGCPRSGTTFLQAALARHPQILSLWETTYFEHLYGDADRWIAGTPRRTRRGFLGFARGRMHKRGSRDLVEIAGRLKIARPWIAYRWSESGYIRGFLDLLDRGCRLHQREIWLEKSPIHLAYIEQIEKEAPDALFIHILRRGEDVVASIVDAGVNFHDNEIARGFDRWIPLWVDYWNRAMDAHLQHAQRPNHCFVCHEDLVRRFPEEMQRIHRFLEIDAQAGDESPSPALPISDAAIEPWKKNAISGQPQVPKRKFEALFGPELQQWIRNQLRSYAAVKKQLVLASALPAYGAPLESASPRASGGQTAFG